jgi:hypothetical protein
MGFWTWLGNVAYKAVLWLGKAILAASAWGAAHPLIAIGAGALVSMGGVWLEGQDWAGAEILGTLVSTFGMTISAAGLGAFIFQETVAAGLSYLGSVSYYLIGQEGDRPWWIRWWEPFAKGAGREEFDVGGS